MPWYAAKSISSSFHREGLAIVERASRGYLIAACGGAGGIFLALLSLSQALTGANAIDMHKLMPQGLGGFLVGVAVLFGMGALVATVSGETVPLKALAIGIGLPAMVSLYMSPGSANGPGLRTAQRGHMIGSAYAQAASPRQMQVSAGDALDPREFQIVFATSDGRLLTPQTVSASGSVQIPADAMTVAVQGPDGGWSEARPLPNGAQAFTLLKAVPV